MNYSLTSAHRLQRPLDHQRGRSGPKQGSGSSAPLVQLGQRLLWWLGVGVGLAGIIWVAGWWLKGQMGKLWPLSQKVSLILVDPQAGSTTTPWLVQLQPETNTIVVMTLSADQTTELFSGYGQYKLPAVYPLLTLDNRSPAYIRATFSAISRTLVTAVIPWPGLPAAAQAEAPKGGAISLANVTKMYQEKVWSKDTKWSERTQNFKAWKQAWQWRWFAEQTDVRWVWTTDPKALLSAAEPAADQCPMAVVNATEIKGLARQISSVLTANGYTTVRTTVDSTPSDQSHVWLDPAAAAVCGPIGQHIATLLPTSPQPELNGEITKLYRAPIVIVVGGDITK